MLRCAKPHVATHPSLPSLSRCLPACSVKHGSASRGAPGRRAGLGAPPSARLRAWRRCASTACARWHPNVSRLSIGQQSRWPFFPSPCLAALHALPQQPHPPFPPALPLAAAFITDLARLSVLAAAAAGQEDPRPPVTVDTILGPVIVPASVVSGPPMAPLPPTVTRAPVVWQQPLPAALRKFLPPEAAGARKEPLPVGAPPAEGAEVQAAAFQPKHYRQLYRLVHQHAQLLMQVRGAACMSCCACC